MPACGNSNYNLVKYVVFIEASKIRPIFAADTVTCAFDWLIAPGMFGMEYPRSQRKVLSQEEGVSFARCFNKVNSMHYQARACDEATSFFLRPLFHLDLPSCKIVVRLSAALVTATTS